MAQQLERQHSDQLATDTPLAKAFLGGHGGALRAAYAILCLKKYTGLKWSDGSPMDLYGADQDEANFTRWLTSDKKKFPNLKVLSINNASRAEIKSHMENLVTVNPGVVFLYIQGHGLPGVYITGDGPGPESGLESTELIELFSNFNNDTLCIVITDLCHSGNFLRLRYRLEIDADEKHANWVGLEGRNQGLGDNPSQHFPPMLHFSGSTDGEIVYETKNLGGYFTNASYFL
ncbi:unnamed protein product [Rhizoctonia solani]|uniref:Peptidase C14 caspase domain-containing protein n=1 Tax=Rhizoctonia solani TaxID=456999 RepID=A0A8H2Y2C9_9AGAM|nr:unnamed protein product [Rhizoctonia solani]